MAGYKSSCSALLLNLFISIVLSAKLNVPRVLLPVFKQFQTNFTLEVFDTGCYLWTSSRPDIVQVLPLEIDETRQCCLKAVVAAITIEPTRNTVIVLAENVDTGFILRCDVIVDVIDSLNIVTTTKELFMEEAPEMFEVCAVDNQGNQFTTVEGVEFHWSIENIGQHPSSKEVLRFISFIDSPYETPHSVEKFDAIGLQGHKVLIEGVKTGTAKVSVSLAYQEYSQVRQTDVLLTVLANLLLDPPDIYILAGDVVEFRLLQMQHGRLDQVPLPSPQYVLDVEDSEVAVLDRSVSTVRGVRVGQTRVLLRDKHSEGTVKLPNATIVVTEPAYLRLYLQPHNNWVIVVDELCAITVQIYDRGHHRIHLGDAVSVKVTVSKDYFQVNSKTRNGTVVDGATRKVGTVPVTATLESISGQAVKSVPPISTKSDMFVYPRLAVTPGYVMVPWDSNLTKYEIQMTASGGDSNYLWRSKNASVVTVSQTGAVHCICQGRTSVVVSLAQNPAVRTASSVEVRPPSHLEILKYTIEAPVNEQIILHIALYADEEDENGYLKRVPFTHCGNINFEVELSNENFFRSFPVQVKPVDNACGTVAIIGKIFGTSVVKVLYTFNNLLLEASTEVAAYNPLHVIEPERRLVVLAVGTSRHVVWKGGPHVWLSGPGKHVHSVTASSSAITVNEVSNPGFSEFYVYSVLCREFGEYKVELSVKNAARNKHLDFPASTSSVKVICAKPRTISFSVERPPNTSCPFSADSSKIVALSYEPITLYVTVKDSNNRVFDNATSLYLDWLLSSNSLGFVEFDGNLVLEERKENNYVVPIRHYQIIHPKNNTGTLIVEAVVTNYRFELLSVLNIVPENPVFFFENDRGEKVKPVIKTSLSVTLVEEATLTPDRATAFNHPNNKVSIKVAQGSGFYKLYQSSLEIASVKYKESTKTIEVYPKSDGQLQITVLDLCLSYKSPVVDIQVLKVGSLQVEMVERVQKGSSITATVWLYDSVENSLAVADSELLELRPHVESNLVTASRSVEQPADGRVNFLITGVELGNTFITFTSGYDQREIRSTRLAIEVFPPLQLIPQDIFLPVGAIYQVSPSGGPQQDFTMEYDSTDGGTAKVSAAGLIEAQRVGDVVVTGTAVGQTKRTKSKVVYSKDKVNVRVVQLEGIKIHSPLTKIKVNCQMPVWVNGVPDKLTPLLLGSVQPSLTFKWSTSTPEVVDLQDALHSTGIEVLETDRLSMRVRALKPGRVTIYLNVTSKQGKYGEFSDQLHVEVLEEFRLVKPKPLRASTLLMSPFSYLRLRTNKDSSSEITYNVIGSPGPSYSLQERALSKTLPVIAVNRAGVVTSHGALGTASVDINSIEDHGIKQILPINIEVKPIHYIMLSVTTTLPVGSTTISALPRGLDLDMLVSYHDSTGEVFAATRTDIRTLLNTADTVKVMRGEVNGTLVGKLTSYGSAVLKVYDDSTPKKSQDYMKLRVEHLITPSKGEIIVGDVLCYSMPLSPGKWATSAPAVLSVDTRSGLATALRPGQATVMYSLTSPKTSVTTSTQLTVLTIHSIVFLPLDGRNLTDWGAFSVTLLLRSERETGKVNNLIKGDSPCPTLASYNVPPFVCEIRFNSPMAPVDIHHMFNIHPSFCVKTGLYSCRFEAINSPSANTSVLTSNVTLRAVSGSLVSEPLVVPFLPSVFLPIQELMFTDSQLTTSLTVIGVPVVLAQVQVVPSAPTCMLVDGPNSADTNRLVYQVSLTAAPPLGQQQVYLYAYSPLTGQNITVPVRLNVRADSLPLPCLAHPVSQWFQLLVEHKIAIISIVVIVAALWYSNIFHWTPSQYHLGMAGSSTQIGSTIYSDSPLSPDSQRVYYRQPFSNIEPVYGDPNLSPNLTRRTPR